jgi:hypothetical protein
MKETSQSNTHHLALFIYDTTTNEDGVASISGVHTAARLGIADCRELNKDKHGGTKSSRAISRVK